MYGPPVPPPSGSVHECSSADISDDCVAMFTSRHIEWYSKALVLAGSFIL